MMKHWHVELYHGTLGFCATWVLAPSPAEAFLVAAMLAAYDHPAIVAKLHTPDDILIAGFQIHDITEVKYAHAYTPN